ncbi:ethyl tert-butyl ether degradation protein EthD [Cupriavidus necator]
MSFCAFLTASSGNMLSLVEIDRLSARVGDIARAATGLRGAILHAPTILPSNDPFLQTEIPPACVLQLYFGDIDALEDALTASGAAGAVVNDPALSGCTWTQQAMAVRTFAVPAPCKAVSGERREAFTYLVAYDGHAVDNNAWLSQYIRQHPPIMTQLPAVREVEVCSRVDYCSSLDIPRATAIQRNKVVFDSASALAQSLASPVRHALRRDFESLPRFEGVTPHYPMRSLVHDLAAEFV